MSSQLSLFDMAAKKAANDARMSALRDRTLICMRCPLSECRVVVVLGEGCLVNPPIAFIGGTPGHAEDMTGRPFQGQAGKLLDDMLRAMGYRREQLFLTNLTMCKPPQRLPTVEEQAACEPLLLEQLKIVAPKVIVPLGETAAKYFTAKPERDLRQLRGLWFTWQNIPVLATYHPITILQQADQRAIKQIVWDDLKSVMEKLRELE